MGRQERNLMKRILFSFACVGSYYGAAYHAPYQLTRNVFRQNPNVKPHLHYHVSNRKDCVALAAQDSSSKDDNDNNSKKKAQLGRKEGVYVRPSAAIERGSGFFVPGLEGPKVRLAGGLILLTLTALNHVLSSSATTTSAANTFQEGLAAAFSTLVLIQAAIEYTKEMRSLTLVVEGSSSDKTSTQIPATTLWQQQWLGSAAPNPEFADSVEWVAQTYLSLTPATHMALLGPGSIVYWLGSTGVPTRDDKVAAGCQAALETCLGSQSGRVSLPVDHPTVQSLAPDARCVVLQRVDGSSQLCWMVASDQLLASFTKRDLQWIGQLAKYVQNKLTR